MERRFDPRTIVTPYAFAVHPDLLGRRLATPWQRLGAILVEAIEHVPRLALVYAMHARRHPKLSALILQALLIGCLVEVLFEVRPVEDESQSRELRSQLLSQAETAICDSRNVGATGQ